MIVNWTTFSLIGIYILMVAGAAFYLSWMTIQRKKNIEKMMENIMGKLAANVTLTAKEVVHLGRGFDLSPKLSGDAVYRLYTQTNDVASYELLKTLVTDIEREEAFDELPDEVKPSLSRLGKLIEQSNEPSDKHILLPLTTTLGKYVELKAEQEKAKKQTARAYIITVISFLVGTVSFYYTLKSPSEADIKRDMAQVLNDKGLPGQNPNPAQSLPNAAPPLPNLEH